MTRQDMTVPPEESEIYVCGAMMLDPSCIGPVTEILTGRDYHNRGLGQIHSAIVRLWSEGKPPEPALVAASVRDGLSIAVADCYQSVGTAVSAPHHAQIIKDAAIRRGVISEASSIVSLAKQDQRPATDVLGDAQARMLALSGQTTSPSLEDTSAEVLADAMAAKDGGNPVVGVPTGFRKMDMLTGGLMGGDMRTIAARPSVGKTSDALDEIIYLLEHTDYGVGLFSAEMPRKRIAARLISKVSGINLMKIRTGQLSEYDQAAIEDAHRKISAWSKGRLFVDDRPRPTFGYMTSAVMRATSEGRVDAVFIDQFSHIGGTSKYENEASNLSDRAHGVKEMAMRLSLPVTLLAQLRRQGTPDGKMRKPHLEELKGTGALEEVSDIVILAHRATKQATAGVFTIGKQRDGAADVDIPMRYRLETASWKEM